MSNIKKLIIFDPTLKNFDGHAYFYDLSIYRAASNYFNSVKIYVHPQLKRYKTEFKNVKYIKFFAFFDALKGIFKSKYLSKATDKKKVLKDRAQKKRLLSKLKFIFEYLFFLQAFCFMLVKERCSENDIIFIQYITFPQVCVLLDLERRYLRFVKSKPKICVIIRYDIEQFTMSYGSSAKLLSINNSSCIQLFSDSIQLKNIYETLLKNKEVVALPVPVFNFKNKISKSSTDTSAFNVGFLGATREEKGFNYLPNIIKKVGERKTLAAKNLNFMIQINKNFPSNLSVSVEELNELARKSKTLSKTNILQGPLDDCDYLNALQSLDVMLMPYISSKYQNSTSGLFLEALENDSPVICGKMTWAGKIVLDAKDEGLMIGECFTKIDEIPVLIEKIILSIKHYRKGIKKYLIKNPTGSYPDEIAKKLFQFQNANL